MQKREQLRQQLLLLRARLLELRDEAVASVAVIEEIEPTDTVRIKAAMEYSKRRMPIVDAEIVRIRKKMDQIAEEIKSL